MLRLTPRSAVLLAVAFAACAASRAVAPAPSGKPLPTKTINGRVEAFLPDGGTLRAHRCAVLKRCGK